MKRILITCCIALALVACDKKEPEASGAVQETTAPTTAAQAEEPADQPSTDDAPPADGDAVAVAADGTKFDPAIAAAKLPDGAWYCDMGTVHYARTEKGDGKCEVCGMNLKQKGAAAPAKDDSHDHGEDGHHHGEGEHDHAH